MNLYKKFMGESTDTKKKIDSILDTAYSLFRSGEFTKASEILSEALSIDFDQKEVVTALKCASFWSERQTKLTTMSDREKKGDYLLEQWKIFTFFLEKVDDVSEQCMYAIRQFVFGRGLLVFEDVLEKKGRHDSDVLFKIGKCYKGKGDYEHALEYFEVTSHQKLDNSMILSELADCYAFINEVKASKIFFREAFFLDPQGIDITSLESMLIRRIIQRLKSMGFVLPELLEWVPVYGVLFGVFNVKRELKPLEYGKLKQAIVELESKLQSGNGGAGFVVPRLLNRYFWMIDHLLSIKSDRDNVEKVLQKIKSVDESIYNQYVN
jgi:tetratricopeptide (TPR) repeat protein